MQTTDFSYKWWALIGLSLLSFTVFLDFTIVTTAIPFIQKDMHASILELQWVTNIFGMITSMFMIAAGRSGDLFGRKKVFYTGFFLFGVAAIGAAISHTMDWLIFFRGVQGFAAAIIATVGVALLPQAFPEKEQTRAIGIFSAFNGAGLALGPFVGGLLISVLSWRWVFWVNIPIIIIGLLCCAFTLKSSPLPNHKIKLDWWGLILLIVGLGCLIYGIIAGEQQGWNILSTWIFIGVGILALLLLIIVENKVEQPLLDFSLFKNPQASLAMLVCMTAGLVVFVLIFFDPLYLNLIRKQEAILVGITLLTIPAVLVIMSLFWEKLVKKINVITLLLYGIGIALLATLCHAFFTPTITIFFVLLGLIPLGYTWGISNIGTITALSQVVPSEKMGGAIGTMFTFWNLSGSIFLALATVIFHWRQHGVMTVDSFMNGFHWVAWCSAAVMFIILLAGLALRR